MEGPPRGPGGEDITWPDQVAPRGRKASSTRKIKLQTSTLHVSTSWTWFVGFFWVTFPCLLTLIHSIGSTLGIETCLGMLENVLESFEPILPSLWHSRFTWLQPGLYRALKTTLS